MADNTRGGSQDGADPLIATDEVTYSGDTADVQLTRPVHVTGAEGSKTVVDVTSADGLIVTGNVASDAVDAGNPVKIGGRAETTTPASVADGDRVDAWFSDQGALSVFIHPTFPVVVSDVDSNPIVVQGGGVAAALQVGGNIAHDAGDVGYPIKTGGKANAAAPTDVSANDDRVDAWFLRNGAQATVVTAAGALIGGDAANGLDVDVTRLPALPAGTNNIGDVDILTIAAGDNNIGNVDIVTMPNVTIGAAIPAGTNNIGDVDVLTLPGVGGLAAHASATSGNPVYIAGRASAAIPTDVGADGDAAGMWTNRNGATVVLMAPHVGLNSDPWALVHEGAQYTSAQTSTVLVAGGASEKIVVTKVQIQAFATTAGTAILYFGTGAYSRGTNRALFDGEFAPSATLKPGVVLDGPFISGANGDDLLVTTTNALSITFSVWYYLVT
jgi:hypothetical protein